jgi:hypothetical protein
MQGLMMNRPLMISALLMHAAENHSDTEIVSRLPVGRHPPLYLQGCPPPLAPTGAGAAVARRQGRGPRRHAGLEHPSPFRDLFRRLGHGRDLPHHQSAPVPRADFLHRQPRRRPRHLLRREFRRPDRGPGAALPRRQGLGRALRPRGNAGQRDPQPALLRGTAGGAEGRLRVAGVRREHRVLAVLHLGHHGQPQGCALLAPLHGAACLRFQPARRPRRLGARLHPAGGADVPRQCLGPALCLLADRRQAGDARPAPRRRQPVFDVRRGKGHHVGRRADHLAGPAALPADQQAQAVDGQASGHRRLGGAAGHDPRLRPTTSTSPCCTPGA